MVLLSLAVKGVLISLFRNRNIVSIWRRTLQIYCNEHVREKLSLAGIQADQ